MPALPHELSGPLEVAVPAGCVWARRLCGHAAHLLRAVPVPAGLGAGLARVALDAGFSPWWPVPEKLGSTDGGGRGGKKVTVRTPLFDLSFKKCLSNTPPGAGVPAGGDQQ